MGFHHSEREIYSFGRQYF
uniref:Uncharacterized protein n=1 Tax=Rhizophora mucronata TaxID=61149 RepID=A0A2P2P8N8_RHIMU